ncbi:MAG: hypothetical protein RSA97_02515 [Oscillospiraceae bacterium]
MKQKIQKALNSGFNQLPHIPFNQISELPIDKLLEHDEITRQTEPKHIRAKKRSLSFRRFSVAFACCLMMIAAGAAWLWQDNVTSGIITIDINPSFEISINNRDRVLKVQALNGDAEEFLSGKNFHGWKTEDAVEALFSALGQSRYFSNEKKNTVLISVQSKNIELAKSLEITLSSKIEKALEASNKKALITCQEVDDDDEELKQNAKANSISVGKMKLILQLKEHYLGYSAEQLAKMPLEELVDMYEDAQETELDKSDEKDDDGDDNSDDTDSDKKIENDSKANEADGVDREDFEADTDEVKAVDKEVEAESGFEDSDEASDTEDDSEDSADRPNNEDVPVTGENS